MRVKFLRNVGRQQMQKNPERPLDPVVPGKADGSPYLEGEVGDLENDVAEQLIQAGLVAAAEGEDATPRHRAPAPAPAPAAAPGVPPRKTAEEAEAKNKRLGER